MGCIPASAGESPSMVASIEAMRVHPRERGGISICPSPMARALGASPRARGNRHAAQVDRRVAGCIPASAGESTPRCRRCSQLGVHPRERGGISHTRSALRTSAGASPRARGNREARRAVLLSLGCIPASAGESGHRESCVLRGGVHPRERGGITSAPIAVGTWQGASPRARGNPDTRDDLRLHCGCIPASAGESR